MTKQQVKQANKFIVDYRVSISGILCLTALEVAAMHYGINGTMRTIIFSMIALIVGIQLPQFKVLERREN